MKLYFFTSSIFLFLIFHCCTIKRNTEIKSKNSSSKLIVYNTTDDTVVIASTELGACFCTFSTILGESRFAESDLQKLLPNDSLIIETNFSECQTVEIEYIPFANLFFDIKYQEYMVRDRNSTSFIRFSYDAVETYIR